VELISTAGFGASAVVSAGAIWSSRDAAKINPTGVIAEGELLAHFARQLSLSEAGAL